MDYLEILSYLWRNHKRFQKQVRTYQHDDLFGDMGFSLSDNDKYEPHHISRSYASKILNGKVRPERVQIALEDPKTRERIQNSFDLPDLFACNSTSEIDTLIESKMLRDEAGTDSGLLLNKRNSLFKSSHKQNYEMHSLGSASEHEPVLSGGERGAWRRLARLALRSDVGVVHWDAEPWSGASYIAHLLREHDEILKSFSKICTIRPSDLGMPFDAQLKRLAAELGVKGDRASTPKALVDAIRRERILLVVSDVCFIPFQKESYEKELLIYQVLKCAVDMHAKGACASVITVGRSSAVTALVAPYNRSYQLDKVLKSQTGFEFYRELFEHYKEHRDETRAEEGGSRLKRGRWHYEAVKRSDERSVWPGMIRLRAYFASNFGNYAYFDPTMGFDALCGRDAPLPKNIELFHDDLVAYIIRAAAGKQSPELRALRFCSTAKHWLTEPALDSLRQFFAPKGTDGYKVSELTREAFENKVKDRLCPITDQLQYSTHPQDDENAQKIFTLSLGIRSIVQDEWRRVDPFERSVAHWRVARNLWKNQDSKELLAQEFPYLPHWGRSRIFLLGECIRHLVCCVDGVSGVSDLTVRGSDEVFPEPPDPSLLGCDPSEVINFCYSRIFQREINGNKAFGKVADLPQQGRSLAKRHGAFEYAAELLQLMGENRVLGKPHPNLNPRYRVSYLRECAFALLDLGELERANKLFKSLEKEHTKDSKPALEEKLNRTLVLTELNDLKFAKKTIRSVERTIRKHLNKPTMEGGSALQRRVHTRNLRIMCLEGKFVEAIELSSEILESERDPRRWDPDLIHTRIRALANIEKTSSQAMSETMAAVFRASADGFQHEALGYRVLLARLFRQRGELSVAEQLLDDIQRDILLYGCSERTYLDMLYEAGRTLCAMNKHIRAYASYFRPLLVRSRSRGFSRFVDLATRHSKVVVELVKATHVRMTGEEWDEVIQLIKGEEEKHVNKEKLGREGILEVDPLFGYYISGSQDVIEQFRTVEGIDEEFEFILGDGGVIEAEM